MVSSSDDSEAMLETVWESLPKFQTPEEYLRAISTYALSLPMKALTINSEKEQMCLIRDVK